MTNKAPRPWRLDREGDYSSLVDANGEPIFQVDDDGGILADPDVWIFMIEAVNTHTKFKGFGIRD